MKKYGRKTCRDRHDFM